MKKLTRIMAMALVLVMALGLAACSPGESGDTWNITYWMPTGEDVSYYPDYEYNPVYKYISENYEFNGKHINIDFNVAPPGSQADDFTTLLSTGSYSDVMDLNMAGTTAPELLEDEIIYDLTDYVPQYMPNYWAYVEANPEFKDVVYTYINGEPRILGIRGLHDAPEPNFQGYCYRRDWIVKYGTNPKTGAAFTGGFSDPSDPLSWTDDVVFPNGTDEPIYISDWEWMFEIFTRAIAAEDIKGGYCYAPLSFGYQATGDLYSGFGGGAPYWYMDGDTVVNGVINDNMRAYLQCLNTWYNNGWLDEVFDEHTGDLFFSVDTSSVFQGKVGLWQGRQSTVGTQLGLDGVMVYGCRQPINDIYGGDAQKGVEPNMMYQYARYNTPIVCTKNLSEDELIAFLEFIDFLYTEEGMVLVNVGLNAEQLEKTPSELYEKLGVADGAYTTREENGVTIYVPKIDTSSYDFGAITLNRVGARHGTVKTVDRGYDRYVTQAHDAWDYYLNQAYVPEAVLGSVSVDQNKEITKIRASYDSYLQRTVPAMIKGEGYDIWDDAGWNSFVSSVVKYRSEEITNIYQTVYDSLSLAG